MYTIMYLLAFIFSIVYTSYVLIADGIKKNSFEYKNSKKNNVCCKKDSSKINFKDIKDINKSLNEQHIPKF
jgi:hypothetical protein